MNGSAFSFSRTIAGAAFLSVSMAASAQALPQFTFDPSAVGLSGAAFTADNIIISNYSTATLTPNLSGGADFTETGVLPVSAFQLGSNFVVPGGLNTSYGLYFGFDGAGTQSTPTLEAGTIGSFDTLTFTLYGHGISGAITYLPTNTTPTGATDVIALATGTLIDGGVGATEVNGVAVPNANTLLTFTPTAAGADFFVDPNPFYQAVFSAFTNNPSQIEVTSSGFVITQGGGSANFLTTATPEPASMALLGAGLLGLGFLRRRA